MFDEQTHLGYNEGENVHVPVLKSKQWSNIGCCVKNNSTIKLSSKKKKKKEGDKC